MSLRLCVYVPVLDERCADVGCRDDLLTCVSRKNSPVPVAMHCSRFYMAHTFNSFDVMRASRLIERTELLATTFSAADEVLSITSLG